MRSEWDGWEAVELGELCSFRAGSAFKPDLQGKSVGRYPFIKVRDLSNHENSRFIRSSANWVDDEDVAALKAKPFAAQTVVFAKIGEALKSNRFRVLTQETLIDNNLMGAIPDPNRVDFPFFHYLLQELKIPELATGSAMPYLKQGDLVKLPVNLPPVDEQRRIARVLGALDDKIESNRRTAATLEEIAATLFKARFVDFVDHDDLVESEIWPIPRGWEVGSLSEIGSVHRDMTDGTSGLPYIGLDVMPRGSTVLSEWQADDSPTGQSTRFEVGDILFGKLRPYFRKVGIAPIDGRCSTEILVLRPHDLAYHGFLFGHVSSQRFIDHCVSVSRGTRMPRSEWKDAGLFEVAVPPSSEVAELDRVMKSVYGTIRARIHESRTLATLRDALLPKFISGQIRVPADAFEDAKAA